MISSIMNSCISIIFLLVIQILLLLVSVRGYEDASFDPTNTFNIPNFLSMDNGLSYSYYDERCPDLERIVNTKVNQWVHKDPSLSPSLIRLHFHDCAVRGCDGSILLEHDGSERCANGSKTLRGFELIEAIKEEVESKCPKTVSCADILTAAARDATVAVGGPFWMVPYGRKDGRVSIDKEAEEMLPMGHESITALIQFFQSKGLNVLDLVVLSGSHTIGKSTCGSLQHRLFNYNGRGGSDPSIDVKYLNFLRRKCRWASEYVYFDAITPTTFDNQYYINLQKYMGLLSTDQLLYSDSRTKPLVNAMASDASTFYNQFAASMVKLGNVLDVSIEDGGEIRKNCKFVNQQKKY